MSSTTWRNGYKKKLQVQSSLQESNIQEYLTLVPSYGKQNPRGINKGRSSKFREGSRVRQTPEEGQRAYPPKHYGNNNKDNSPKTLNDKETTFVGYLMPKQIY